MNAKQKDFIRKKLIPFILRENGKGFGMSSWRIIGEAGSITFSDSIPRKMPPCGTVCCIGGSIEMLKGFEPRSLTSHETGVLIGLTPKQADGLFCGWDKNPNDLISNFSWPRKFRRAYATKKSVLGKAKVAVELLKEVIRTEGECIA